MNGDSMFSVSNNPNPDYRNLRETVNQVLQDAPPATPKFSYLQPIEEPLGTMRCNPGNPTINPQPNQLAIMIIPTNLCRPIRFLPTRIMTVLGPEIAVGK